MAKKTTKKKTTKTAKVTRKKVAKKSSKAPASKAPAKKTTKKKTAKKTAGKSPARSSKAATGKKKVAKKTIKKVAKKAASAKIDLSRPPKKIKTSLSTAELKMYRNLLLEKRAELLGDIGTMEEGALRNKDTSNLSNMPLHMADVGSDNYDQELLLGLVESERKLLKEIDEALVRIKDKTYGMCLATGKPINKARLEIKPWAKYSIEAAREAERNGGMRY